MSSAIGVVCNDLAYGAAVAELPQRTRRTRDAPAAIVVVSGNGNWCDGVRSAAAGGALAVIVSHPGVVPGADIRALSGAVADLPVVLERLHFRQDAAFDAVAGRAEPDSGDVRLVAVDGAAVAAQVGTVLRDAIAWARVLTGGTLGRHAASGALALLNDSGPKGVVAALNVVEVDAGDSWIRGHALGETRTEVEVTTERTVVSTAGQQGSAVAPTRFETSQRLALRRALDALGGGDQPLDLAQLVADAELAEQLTGTGSL